MGFPHGSVGEVSVCNAGAPDSIHGLGRSPGEENGYHCSCMESPMDKGAWRAIVQVVAKSQTQLNHLNVYVCTHTHTHARLDFLWRKGFVSVLLSDVSQGPMKALAT